MLELKNISKTYKPKDGQPVKALKSVSVAFGDSGLVFIVGKSGSGKSTLLNCVGGLDHFDSGEVIINGKSSNNFSDSDFDGYRNTFIGFIFQDYNILSEFNVEKNIALALELQGKTATKKDIRKILSLVDLEGMGKRKPNELSGGQKQRVAIARALIKEPEIIIADEPTGALDSETGEQVFETLKKLAKDKLVIAVSHDMELAEIYGDRIIELKDGRVVSDKTKRKIMPTQISDDLTLIGDDVIHIRKGHIFSEDEKKTIIKFLESRDTETIITVDDTKNQRIKQAVKLDAENRAERFTATTDADRKVGDSPHKDLKLIKSKLKFKEAFKMGVSSLHSKPIRLMFSIVLSLVAFTLFGVIDALSAYNRNVVTTNSIIDEGLKNLTMRAEVRVADTYSDWDTGQEVTSYYYDEAKLDETDIKKLSDDLGVTFRGVYNPSEDRISISANFLNSEGLNFDSSYLTNKIAGFVNLTKDDIRELGFTLVGRLPETEKEIVITDYIYHTHTFAGFSFDGTTIDRFNISKDNIIGQAYFLNGNKYTIVGVLDTGFDYGKFSSLDPTARRASDESGTYMKLSELNSVVENGYHALVVTDSSFIKNHSADGFSMAIAQMPEDKNQVANVVNYYYDCLNKDSGFRFVLSNEVTSMISDIDGTFNNLSKLLIWVALAFSVFAGLMLTNFISMSISYKKREIGVLRAIGARKRDVFRIFYYEALVIALINFVLASITTLFTITIVNASLRSEYGLVVSLLHFSYRQVVIIFVVSMIVSLFASLVPVYKISKQQPIDAINNR